MISLLLLGFAIWGLAIIGAYAIAQWVGVLVILAFFLLATAMSILLQKDFNDSYIAIKRKDD